MSKWERAYRRIVNSPAYFDENGELTSAIFKDSNGLSVDLDHLRERESVLRDEERLHEFYSKRNNSLKVLRAIVSIGWQDCESAEAIVCEDPILGENPHHAIVKGKETVTLKRKQCRALLKKMVIEKMIKE